MRYTTMLSSTAPLKEVASSATRVAAERMLKPRYQCPMSSVAAVAGPEPMRLYMNPSTSRVRRKKTWKATPREADVNATGAASPPRSAGMPALMASMIEIVKRYDRRKVECKAYASVVTFL